MKKRELLRRLKSLAEEKELVLELLRQGANHEIWRVGDLQFPVARHNDVPEQTARGTIRAVESYLEAQ